MVGAHGTELGFANCPTWVVGAQSRGHGETPPASLSLCKWQPGVQCRQMHRLSPSLGFLMSGTSGLRKGAVWKGGPCAPDHIPVTGNHTLCTQASCFSFQTFVIFIFPGFTEVWLTRKSCMWSGYVM